ncbi:MAG: carbohydrate ABC transporter permease [bacterium]
MKRSKSVYLFLAPALVMVVVFLLFPMVYTLSVSFTRWDGLSPPKFNGFENYIDLFGSRAFLVSLKNTFIWVIFTLLLPVGLGLLIAWGVSNIKLAGLFKAVFYIPLTLSAVTTGLIWVWMYGPQLGVLNNLFRALHLDFLAHSWLTEVPLNTYSMIFAWAWRTTGSNMIMFLIGLQALPKEPIEASQLDGFSKWQTFIYVIVPMLRSMTTVVVAMALINSFNIFDIIYVMTNGGPYRSSETLAVTMYRESFVLFHMGYGAAVAVVLSIMVLLVSAFYVREMTKREITY